MFNFNRLYDEFQLSYFFLSSDLGIKFLTDINEELSVRRNQLNKLKALQRETDEQKKELQEIQQKVWITYLPSPSYES